MNNIENEFVAKLFDEMYEFLFNYACVRLRDIYSAHDATQETFLAALEDVKKLMQTENPQGWLVEALKFKVLNEQNAKARYVERYHEDETTGLSNEPCEIGNNHSIDELLNEKEYEVLRLVYIEGLSINEAAARLDIKYDTCRMRIKDAKRKLIQEME